MNRKDFIRKSSITGAGTLFTSTLLGKAAMQIAGSESTVLSEISLNRFLQIKKEAAGGNISLFLTDFINNIDSLSVFFENVDFKIGGINLIESSDNEIRFTGESKNFLFDGGLLNVFKNNKVLIDGLISIKDNVFKALVICKLDKNHEKLSSIPGVGKLLKPLNGIRVSDMVYIFSTHKAAVIKSSKFKIFNDRSANIKPGVNLAGFIHFDKSGTLLSGIHQVVKPVLGSGPYFMTWSVTGGADIDFNLQIPQDIKVLGVFGMKNPNIIIKPVNPVYVSLDGSLDLQLPAISVATLGGFQFSPNNIVGKFNLDNIVSQLPPPFGFQGIHISTLTATAGLTNGTPTFGAEGEFYIGPNKPATISNRSSLGGIKSNQYKFVFDAIAGKLTPKFCFLYLDELSLQEYLKAVTNQNISLPSFLNAISLHQVMFHWSEIAEGMAKPDGTIGFPVFGFSAIASVFGHTTFAEIQAEVNDTSGKLVASPIDIGNGLLKIGGNGSGTPAGYRGAVTVQPNGCVFQFSSKGNPYLKFSADVAILGIQSSAEGEVTDTGIRAKTKSNIAGILKNELEFLVENTNFNAKTFISMGIKGVKISLGALGNINLNTTIEGDFEAAYQKDKFSNAMRFAFDFAGVHFDLGRLTTEVEVKDLTKLPELLAQFIKAAIIDVLLNDVLKWLIAALNNGIEFVGEKLEEIGKALKNTFNKTIDEAAALMKQANYVINDVARTLQKGYQATVEEISRALKNAGYQAAQIAAVLKDVFGLTANAAAILLKGLSVTANEVGQVLKAVYGVGDNAAAATLKAIGYGVNEVGDFLNAVYGTNNAATAAALKAIGYGAKEVSGVLRDVCKIDGKTAGKILKGAGFGEKEIKGALKEIFKAGSSILGGLFGGGCILSTAATEYRGLPDDCYELNTLRNFRDEYMYKLNGGHEIVEHYYTLSSVIIKKIHASHEAASFYESLFTDLVQPSIKLIEQRRLDDAYNHYKNYVLKLYDQHCKEELLTTV